MESLLHYCWKHKLFPLHLLTTTDGKQVEVISPGFHNRDAGPDFTQAMVKIDGTMWVGNVEIHESSSDWFRHHHDTDPAYDNIILHVAKTVDVPLFRKDGSIIPQLQLDVPTYVQQNYDDLQLMDLQPRCRLVMPYIHKLQQHSWMAALAVERLEARTQQIMQRRDRLNLDWENVFFVTLSRSLGLGKNGDALEQWAYSIPQSAIAKHRDDLFQIRAIFYGQAGFFEDGYPNKNWKTIADDAKLKSEYKYLRQKFSLNPIDPTQWKFLRLRPQNFPTVRIGQLAEIYQCQEVSLSKILNSESVEAVQSLFAFSPATVNTLIINAVVPILFAYGRYRGNDDLCNRALDFLDHLPPENNAITRQWASLGISCDSANDSQALVQLHNNYCLPHDCLRCRFGYEFIRRTPGFMKEDSSSPSPPS